MAASVPRKAKADLGPDGVPTVPPVRTRNVLPSRPRPPEPPEERRASVHEAKTHLSRLLTEVEAGGTVVITRRGKPVAKLEAVETRPKRIFGSMKGLISIDERFFEPLPEEELKAWEGG